MKLNGSSSPNPKRIYGHLKSPKQFDLCRRLSLLTRRFVRVFGAPEVNRVELKLKGKSNEWHNRSVKHGLKQRWTPNVENWEKRVYVTQAYVCATATAVFSIEKISFHCLLIFLLLVCEWKYKRAQNQYHYIAHRYTANQTKDSSKWVIFRLRPFYKYGRPSFLLFHIFVLLCFVPVRTCVESFSVHTDQRCRVGWNKN